VDFDNITVNASGAITDIGMLTSGTWGYWNLTTMKTLLIQRSFRACYRRGFGLQRHGLDVVQWIKPVQDQRGWFAGLCCGVVIIWVHKSGLRRVQGIDVHPITFVATRSKVRAKINPDLTQIRAGKPKP
jgi:hypothetical protein